MLLKKFLPNLMESHFQLELEVRDYEVDLFGVVNHAVYARYFEHTRHSFLKSHHISLADLQSEGWNPVVTHLDISYKHSLLSGDRMISQLALTKLTKVRFVFEQQLLKLPTKELSSSAIVTGTVLSPSGRPKIPEIFHQLPCSKRRV